mmetsp:Transcript_12554/g.35791  ORF Transcript_12554/g.35791 Transcript_12554/m.35791 type:complete len:244 (-) Transcript_12554:145-876(-)
MNTCVKSQLRHRRDNVHIPHHNILGPVRPLVLAPTKLLIHNPAPDRAPRRRNLRITLHPRPHRHHRPNRRLLLGTLRQQQPPGRRIRNLIHLDQHPILQRLHLRHVRPRRQHAHHIVTLQQHVRLLTHIHLRPGVLRVHHGITSLDALNHAPGGHHLALVRLGLLRRRQENSGRRACLLHDRLDQHAVAHRRHRLDILGNGHGSLNSEPGGTRRGPRNSDTCGGRGERRRRQHHDCVAMYRGK